MGQGRSSPVALVILATLLSYTEASMFNSQPKFTLKAEKNKAFDKSCLVDTFKIQSGNIAECLEHCMQDCRCQSFQICHNTKCQLCSRHKENNLRLHDNNSCIYVVHEMQGLSEKKLNGQCSGMSCSMKYNCCQQSSVCPEHKICKPRHSAKKPWKRFTCRCPKGYRGDHCKTAITSCQGYATGSRKSRRYKIVDPVQSSVYEVYCHFQLDFAWTLVKSYSYGNRSLEQFKKSLFEDLPISESAPTWNGYRLSKQRMQSVKNNSNFLQFTCDYEKHRAIGKLDHVQIPLENITDENKSSIDVLEQNNQHDFHVITIGLVHGRIGTYNLSDCKIRPRQPLGKSLHIHIDKPCLSNCSGDHKNYFGSYDSSPPDCVKMVHKCVQNNLSTTQLWFGERWRKPNSVAAG